MNTIKVALTVIRGAAKGALIALGLAFVFLSVVGLPFGGPLLALYYSGLLLLYVAPVGGVVGTILTGLKLYRHPLPRDGEKTKNDHRPSRLSYLIGVGLPLLLALAVFRIPYANIGIDGTVYHGATWTTSDTYTGYSHNCEIPVVILMLKEYGNIEIVCSAELLNYLENDQPPIVPIVYRVTRDFGSARSYQLINVGPFAITSDEWLGGPSGCGGEYYLPCNSPLLKEGSGLDESSWPTDQTNDSSTPQPYTR